MGKRNQPLTPEQVQRLEQDIRKRIELQQLMAEHTCPVIELELGINTTTIWHMCNGQYEATGNPKYAAGLADEVRRRRDIWHLAREQFQEYTLDALCEKYDRCGMSIRRHIWRVQGRYEQKMYGVAA